MIKIIRQGLWGDLAKVGTPFAPLEVDCTQIFKEDGHRTIRSCAVGAAIVLQTSTGLNYLKGFQSKGIRDAAFDKLLSKGEIDSLDYWNNDIPIDKVIKKLQALGEFNLPKALNSAAVLAQKKRATDGFPQLSYEFWDAFVELPSFNTMERNYFCDVEDRHIKTWAKTLPLPYVIIQAGLSPLLYWRALHATVLQ